MITIAVTGGMGAGKTETTKMFADLGAAVIRADEVAHETYLPKGPIYRGLLVRFGDRILSDDGTIDRRALGALAFRNDSNRNDLQSLVWPETRKLIERRLSEIEATDSELTVIEAAVLYEAQWDDLADVVVTVEAADDVRIDRITSRTGLGESEIRKRVRAQLAPDERIQLADFSISNDGTLDDLSNAVHAVWHQITQTSPTKED